MTWRVKALRPISGAMMASFGNGVRILWQRCGYAFG